MCSEEMIANRLSTDLSAVDAYLRHGIPTDSITEVTSLIFSSILSFFSTVLNETNVKH
jgi:hypothetical protein